MNLSFEYPMVFLFLPFVICFVKCRESAMSIYFQKIDFLKSSGVNRIFLLDSLIFVLFVISLSNPFVYDQKIQSMKKGRDLILSIDTSGSMGERGFGDESRSKFDIVMELAEDFLDKRFDDNAGVVVFGSFAYPASAVTYDLSALKKMLKYLYVGIASNNTAIGEAIEQSLRLLKYSDAKKKVIILLTDGRHNSGRISPKDALLKAKKRGVKIYTIGIGEDFDKSLLEKIAKESKGKMFDAKNKEELEKIYKRIDSLEPSPLRSNSYLNKRTLFQYPLLLSLALLLYRLRRYF